MKASISPRFHASACLARMPSICAAKPSAASNVATGTKPATMISSINHLKFMASLCLLKTRLRPELPEIDCDGVATYWPDGNQCGKPNGSKHESSTEDL